MIRTSMKDVMAKKKYTSPYILVYKVESNGQLLNMSPGGGHLPSGAEDGPGEDPNNTKAFYFDDMEEEDTEDFSF